MKISVITKRIKFRIIYFSNFLKLLVRIAKLIKIDIWYHNQLKFDEIDKNILTLEWKCTNLAQKFNILWNAFCNYFLSHHTFGRHCEQSAAKLWVRREFCPSPRLNLLQSFASIVNTDFVSLSLFLVLVTIFSDIENPA